MDRCSFFVKNRAMFGSFPDQDAVRELENAGVKYFVNLTFPDESKIKPYNTNHTKIEYPIRDRSVPTDWRSFASFIVKISNIIRNLPYREIVYIHCKGGHGRSGIVVACILCFMFKLSPIEALRKTTKCHNKRIAMRDKWRIIGSPQTKYQKHFVCKFFEPILFDKAYHTGTSSYLSNFSPHPVYIEGIGTFPTSEAAFQAHKALNNSTYVEKQKKSKSPMLSKYIGNHVLMRSDWYLIKDNIMYQVVKAKIEQHPTIRDKLLNTCLRPIIVHTKYDNYWSDGGDGSGLNKLGQILVQIRDELHNVTLSV